jgi:hypothetical protein
MSVVVLEILEPKHDSNFKGTRAVSLRGALRSTGHGTLFYKWYSNLGAFPPLPAPTEANPDSSLNRAAHAAPSFDAQLAVGTHIITLAAKDVAEDKADKLKDVKHAGMAGGPPQVPPPPNAAPCVIHVLVAEMTKPLQDASLSKANATLAARVPPLWEDKEYQLNINRLRYRWRFEPTGAPAGRSTVDFEPQLIFDPPLNSAPPLKPKLKNPPFEFDADNSIMSYRGALPPALGTGSYKLWLRVERKDDSSVGHEVSRDVLINP